MTDKQKNASIVVAVIAVIILIAYNFIEKEFDKNSASGSPFFPTQKSSNRESMEALLTGKLTLEGTCLKVRGNLIIWPYGYSVRKHKSIVSIYNDKNQLVARVGDEVKLGGGQLGDTDGSAYLSQFESKNCKGPFWIVGEVLSKK